MAKGKKVSKRRNVKAWKKGINNVKNISATTTYPAGDRKGIRL